VPQATGGDSISPTRLIGLVEGNPSIALSGVAHFLLSALAEQLTVVGTIDYRPRTAARIALAASTFQPDRSRWRARFHTSLLAHRVLSATLSRRIAQTRRDFDVALQVHGWVRGQPTPYAIYVDQTRLMAERGWPAWLPLRPRERARLLALEQEMYARAAHVLAMGTPARDSVVADYGISPARVSVVGGGVMFDRLPVAHGPTGRPPVILFVGREYDRKGLDSLLRAFASIRRDIRGAELRIVGPRIRIDAPGVRSLGLVRDRAQLARLYAGTRVFCLPTRYEPYGLAYLEAMAHGVPCVGTDVQSVSDILDHGEAGALVAPGDDDALAAALVRLLTDDDLAQQLGAAGRRRVETSLLWSHVAARAAPILEEAARQG
jgi:glycosyltransferase involved in cell wall biosynthesis